jgi:ATP-binding cassette, subfamily C, bacterial
MNSGRTLDFVLYFWKAYPLRTALLVFLLALSGLSEAVGVATMVPLLELTVRSSADSSGLSSAVADGLARFGLSPTLGILLSLIVAGMLLKGVFRLLAMKQVGTTVARVSADLRLRLIDSLLKSRWSYFVSQPSGRFSNAIATEAARAANSYRALCALIASAIQTLFYLALAVLVSWQVALMAVFAGLLVVALLGGLVRMSREAGNSQTKYTRALITRLTDALQGIKPIKAMGQERQLQPQLQKETEEINRAMARGVLASEAIMSAQEPVLVTVMATGLYFALTMGSIPLTDLLVMAFLFNRLAGRISILQSDYQSLANGESAFWSMQENIDSASAMCEAPRGSAGVPRLARGIRLERVSFSYPQKPVLKDVSLEIPTGEIVALAGGSGAGKTTIADLVVGLHVPDSGEIFLDDVPLSTVSTAAWRHAIGYVPQEMFLFHDTLLANVSMGDDDIDEADVWEALKLAGAWSFVEQLPAGLETVMGERGSRLSGGQRQRIAIARALARKPKLLILDEITASLDPVSEAEVCETLCQLRGSVTMLAISHQRAILELADRVYLVDAGLVHLLDRYAPSATALGG